MPRSATFPYGNPELCYARLADDVDVLGAIVVLNRLSGLRARTASFEVDPEGLATHASVGREAHAFLTTVRVSEGRLEIVDHGADGPRAVVVIPWTVDLDRLPRHRDTAASAIAAHARTAARLFEHSLRIRRGSGEAVEHNLRQLAGLVVSCAGTRSEFPMLRLPSPWAPAAIVTLGTPLPQSHRTLGDAGEALAAHLLPRTHYVGREPRPDDQPTATVLSPLVVPADPMDHVEAMRRLEQTIRVLGRRDDAEGLRTLLAKLGAAT